MSSVIVSEQTEQQINGSSRKVVDGGFIGTRCKVNGKDAQQRTEHTAYVGSDH